MMRVSIIIYKANYCLCSPCGATASTHRFKWVDKCLKRRGCTNLIRINAFQSSVHISCYFSIALFQTQSTNIADAQCSKFLHNNLRVLILIISPVIECFFSGEKQNNYENKRNNDKNKNIPKNRHKAQRDNYHMHHLSELWQRTLRSRAPKK